jgi:hypothetical protein
MANAAVRWARAEVCRQLGQGDDTAHPGRLVVSRSACMAQGEQPGSAGELAGRLGEWCRAGRRLAFASTRMISALPATRHHLRNGGVRRQTEVAPARLPEAWRR